MIALLCESAQSVPQHVAASSSSNAILDPNDDSTERYHVHRVSSVEYQETYGTLKLPYEHPTGRHPRLEAQFQVRCTKLKSALGISSHGYRNMDEMPNTDLSFYTELGIELLGLGAFHSDARMEVLELRMSPDTPPMIHGVNGMLFCISPVVMSLGFFG
jgi:hypothetical protein